MDKTRDFSHLEPYVLRGVQMTGRELGRGSFATVHEVEYMGLKCAGKKIHNVLVQEDTVRRFEAECHLLSLVHHPNIVQFLGVHFQRGVRVPILVMEYLPTNLSSCIEKYGILPKEIGYSVLHDVALGLHYLHNQSAPIIHRDISSNNILLTTNMLAKISDLGVARIFKFTASFTTFCPGTPVYMPPEAMTSNPKYDESIDVFSYGILMIHTFSGMWPEPQCGPSRIEADRVITVTEAERRNVFLQAIRKDHPLMELILSCINNTPSCRPPVSVIVKQLTVTKLQFPASFANRLDMLIHIKHLEEKVASMAGKDVENHRNLKQISEETDTSGITETSELETKQAIEKAMFQAIVQRESSSTSTLNIITRFRTMLTHISEHLTQDNAQRLAYINGLPSPSNSTHHKQLDVLTELEKRGVFSHKNIDPLIDLLTDLHRADIINSCQIREFKEWVENVYRYKSPFYCTSQNSGIMYLSEPIPPESTTSHNNNNSSVDGPQCRLDTQQPQKQSTCTCTCTGTCTSDATGLDLAPILKLVSPLSSQWKTLGVYLHVNSDKLDEIEANYKKVSDCMREMLREWLKKDTPSPSTWETLANEVEELNPSIAKQIRTEYCNPKTNNTSCLIQ